MPASIAVSGIAAQAFRFLELSPISSFGDESEQGIAAADQYPVALDMCLERGDWSFASTVALLSPVIETAKDERLPTSYQAPGDLVTIRELDLSPASVSVAARTFDWRLDGDRLRADATGTLWVRYTRRVTNETHLPGMFKTAVAYQLAALIGPRFAKTRALSVEMQDRADAWIERALMADARNASPRRMDGGPPAGDWASEAVR